MVKGHRGFTLCTKRQHLSNIPESYLYLHNQGYRERKNPSSNASTHPGSGCGGSSLSSPDLPFPSHLPQLTREGETAEAFPGQSVSRVYLESSSLCYVPGTPRQLVVLLRLSALSLRQRPQARVGMQTDQWSQQLCFYTQLSSLQLTSTTPVLQMQPQSAPSDCWEKKIWDILTPPLGATTCPWPRVGNPPPFSSWEPWQQWKSLADLINLGAGVPLKVKFSASSLNIPSLCCSPNPTKHFHFVLSSNTNTWKFCYTENTV